MTVHVRSCVWCQIMRLTETSFKPLAQNLRCRCLFCCCDSLRTACLESLYFWRCTQPLVCCFWFVALFEEKLNHFCSHSQRAMSCLRNSAEAFFVQCKSTLGSILEKETEITVSKDSTSRMQNALQIFHFHFLSKELTPRVSRGPPAPSFSQIGIKCSRGNNH